MRPPFAHIGEGPMTSNMQYLTCHTRVEAHILSSPWGNYNSQMQNTASSDSQ